MSDSDVEFLSDQDNEASYSRPAPQTYSETVQWLVSRGYFKTDTGAKAFLISISVIFFAISFYLVYVASTYVSLSGTNTLESINFEGK